MSKEMSECSPAVFVINRWVEEKSWCVCVCVCVVEKLLRENMSLGKHQPSPVGGLFDDGARSRIFRGAGLNSVMVDGFLLWFSCFCFDDLSLTSCLTS